MSVRASEEDALRLSSGDELFANYKYDMSIATDMFPWYVELYKQLEPQILARERELAKPVREDNKDLNATSKLKKEKSKKTKRKKTEL